MESKAYILLYLASLIQHYICEIHLCFGMDEFNNSFYKYTTTYLFILLLGGFQIELS